MPKLPISVVIPALNAETFIGEAIASIHAQTSSVSEIIVVDNGCADRTAEIALQMGAKVVPRTDARGISRARNAGIVASTQKWVAFLDADDRWHPKKIEQQWAAIRACPQAGMVSCYLLVFENGSIVFNNPVRIQKQTWRGYRGRVIVNRRFSYFPKIERDFFPRFQPSPSDVMIRRDVFSTVGAFDEEILYCEDFEFFLRVMARFPFVLVERVLVHNRRHPRKHSFHLREMRSGIFAVVNKMLKHRENYPPGAPEIYRDILKTQFLSAEASLHRLS